MKVIDLLNKIANGEEVPKHIKLYDTDWYWNDYDGYVDKWSLSTTPDAQTYLYEQYRLDFSLNKEIEIIEEPKKIEKIDIKYDRDIEDCVAETYINGNFYKEKGGSKYDEMIVFKLNEIINYINKENKL